MSAVCVYHVFGLLRGSSAVASCLIQFHLSVAAYPNRLPDSVVAHPVSMDGITGINKRSVREHSGIEIAQL